MSSLNSNKMFSIFAMIMMLATAFAGVSLIGSALTDEDSSAATNLSWTQGTAVNYNTGLTYNNLQHYEIESGSLPSGVTKQEVSGTYYFKGTPTTAGSYSVTLRATNVMAGVWDDTSTRVSYSITVTGTTTNYTVTISAGTGGSVSKSSVTVASGTSISTSGNTLTIGSDTITANANDNYTFSSWSNASGTVIADRTITANFSPSATNYTHTIQYQAGGSGVTNMPSPNPQTVTNTSSSYSMTVTSTVPQRSGYTFAGWSYNGTTYWAGQSVTVGSNATVYLTAQWSSNAITITSSQSNTAITTAQSFVYNLTSNTSGATLSISGANWLSGSANGSTYTISGMPPAAGTYNVTLTLSKTGYTSATQSFTITVENVLAFTSSPTSGFYVVG